VSNVAATGGNSTRFGFCARLISSEKPVKPPPVESPPSLLFCLNIELPYSSVSKIDCPFKL
jgi:hypothetical protein